MNEKEEQAEVTQSLFKISGSSDDSTKVRSGTEPDGSETISIADGTLVDTNATPREGQVFGNYEILGELARGGMGVVYRAKQSGAERVVALKVIRGGLPGSHETDRFQAEVRAAAKLDHPGIVPIFDVGRVDDQPYFTMKLIQGQSLAQRISGKPLEPKFAARIVKDVSDAIAHAHAAGIVHRDLKPGNVLLDEDSRPLVTDFGLAKFSDEDSALTQTGEAIGTPAYMPPEQAVGDRTQVNELSDVYSLGAILYACMTGRPPFQSATALGTIMQVMREDPAAPRMLNADVPQDLEIICLKCLSKESQNRYTDAGALRDELDRYLSGEPIKARSATNSEKIVKWIRRNPRQALTVLSCGIALIGVGIGISASISRFVVSNSYQAAMIDNTAYGKSHHSIDTLNIVAPAPTYKGEASLRTNLVSSAIECRDFLTAGTLLEQMDSEGAGMEYHLAHRQMNQQQLTIQFAPRAQIAQLAMDSQDRLFVLAKYSRYSKGQVVVFDRESLEVLDRSEITYMERFEALGDQVYGLNWKNYRGFRSRSKRQDSS